MNSVFFYQCPFGKMAICDDELGISEIFILKGDYIGDARVVETPLIFSAHKQLEEYFSGQRRDFDLPLSLHGTPAQKAVWKAILSIPYGETCSERQIADQTGCPQPSRVIRLAIHKNPILIVIPCHRVLDTEESPSDCSRSEMKKKLLELESSHRI